MYDYDIISILYASIHFTVLASVRYYLYKDRLRVPVKWMFLILTVIPLTVGGAWVLTGGIPGMSYDLYRMCGTLFMFLLSCFIIKAPLAEHAFSYAFIMAYGAAEETTAFFIQLNFVPDAPAYVYPVTSAIITILCFYPGVKCLEKMITRLSDMGSDKVWGWLDLAVYSFLFMNLLVTLPHPAKMSLFYPIGRYLMLLGMVGIYKAAVRIMDAMYLAAISESELALTRQRIAVQQSYYDRMVTQMDEVRRMRHDLRHHRSAILAFVKSGDMTALSAYIDEASLSEKILPVTGNLAADSVMLYYMDAANQLGVNMELSLAIGRKTPLTDPDLCIILGNLLENAIDAQKYVAPKDRFIRVTAKGNEKELTLAVDNRFDGTLKQNAHDTYLSRKEGEGHGLGLRSVRAVCEKYGGILQIEAENNLFMAGIVISQ